MKCDRMDENMKNKKWNDYFSNIENKYNLKLKSNSPIVIFIDGKDITKSLNYNLISEDKDSFNDIFEQTIQYFSMKFGCMAISGVDEVSFIFQDGRKLIEQMVKKSYRAHDVVSLFSQQFYQCFHEKYAKKPPIYWHCKCSNIPKGKIKSYIKYRSLTIFELKLTYFLKRKNYKDAGKISLSEKENICNEIPEYREMKKFEKGKLYISGQQVELEAFFNDKIEKVQEKERKEAIRFLDINNF